jgi:putative drug exporter of the RND superfamily
LAKLLYRVGQAIARHPLPVLVAWVVVTIAVVLSVSRVGALTTSDQSLPGTDSQRATDVLAVRFPPQQNGKSPIVFHFPSGTLDAGAQEAAIGRAAKDLAKLPDVVSAPSPFGQQGTSGLAKDKATAFIPVLLGTLAATMVLVLAPALLVLMGGRTWWLSAWLSKVVPHVDIEGKAIAEAQR